MELFGIIGAGIMGLELAEHISERGLRVILYDNNPVQRDVALARVRARMERHEREGKTGAGKADAAMGLIQISAEIEGLAAADIILECVTEDLATKKALFARLDEICKPEVILASITSSISITAIASATRRPESVIGIHFLNPVRVMRLVEIVCGLATTRETFATAKQVVKKLGKEYVEARDYPGFLLNRILMPMINEAIYALYENAGSVEAIDKVMKLGMNHPMGALELADLVGLDIVLAVIEELYRGFGDPKYRPCPLLKQYVAAGYLGRKSGRGFYTY
ncbi:MAG: 3-hydroxybutyryl-CoA dehydrogenase [Spirochaetes bacterium]|nr:MAG: 3-hydroxybutyryl-CoA dehydrogenase [Spirochaetota bacterium]